jgi:hypothetical protein
MVNAFKVPGILAVHARKRPRFEHLVRGPMLGPSRTQLEDG